MSENVPSIFDINSTTNTSTIPVVAPRSKFPKWIIVLILIVMLLVGISAVVATYLMITQPTISSLPPQTQPVIDDVKSLILSSPTPTNEWHVYKNEQLGFQFEYPNHIVITVYDQKVDSRLLSIYFGNQNNPSNDERVEFYEDNYFGGWLSVYSNTNSLTESEQFQQVHECGQPSSMKWLIDESNVSPDYCFQNFLKTITEYKNSPVEGIKGEFNLYEHPTSIIIFNHNDLTFMFEVGGGEAGQDASQNAQLLRDQIISTFSLLDELKVSTPKYYRQTTQCTEPWSKSNQEIVNFLNENYVDVYSISRKSDYSLGSVCEACDCPGGEIIVIDIDSNKEQNILDLGFKPLSGLDSLLNF